MNRKAVSRQVAQNLGLQLKDVERVLKETFSVMAEALASGEESVTIDNFGRFTTTDRAASKTRHIITKEVLDVPARRVARFRPATRLREAVRKNSKS